MAFSGQAKRLAGNTSFRMDAGMAVTTPVQVPEWPDDNPPKWWGIAQDNQTPEGLQWLIDDELNRRKGKDRRAMESLADTEWVAEMAPTLAGTRAEYSTIANDPSRVHHVLSDPDAHPDDRYALERKMSLMGVYYDRNDQERSLAEDLSWPLDRATMYREKRDDGYVEWKQARTPHLGSAKAGLLKGQRVKPGHTYIFPGTYGEQFRPGGQWAKKDAVGQDLEFDPKDVIRHEIGHDASREFMHAMERDYENMVKSGGRPHKDTIGGKFVDRVGFDNVNLFYEMDDHEEILNRYEDFLVGAPADKKMAREYIDGFVDETKDWHKWNYDKAQFLKDNRLKGLEERFTKEQLDILNKYHEDYYHSLVTNVPESLRVLAQTEMNLLFDPSSLLEGTKDKFGRSWALAGNSQDVDDLLEVKGDIWQFESSMRGAKRNLEGVKIIPKIYDAQLQGMKELKESGQSLGSPPYE